MDLSALAGIVGGVAVTGGAMIFSAVTGGGFWSLPNSFGVILAGAKVGNTRSFGIVTLVGIYLHMVLSAIYGIATVYLAHQLNIGFGVVTVSQNDCDDPSGAQFRRVSQPQLPCALARHPVSSTGASAITWQPWCCGGSGRSRQGRIHPDRRPAKVNVSYRRC
jgi:hypothetical protein